MSSGGAGFSGRPGSRYAAVMAIHGRSPAILAALAVLTSCVHAPPDYASHVADLERRLPHAGFHVVVVPPFVVIGDEPERVVESRARDIAAWAVRRLKQEYFTAGPPDILDVWLFKNDESYRHHARELFGEEPSTPYGYYSPRHRAIVLNIATGGGTLVHEIVHPFVHADFPSCPTWFNEGLASLYEQSGEQDGRIRGYTNWRLAVSRTRSARAGCPRSPT